MNGIQWNTPCETSSFRDWNCSDYSAETEQLDY